MSTLNLSTVEIKAFVPAKDFELSKAFYHALGFTQAWASADMAYFHYERCSFLLQNFHVQEYTDNFMMHLLVESADDWHRHLVEQGITSRFGVRMDAPVDQPWGMRDFVLFDPSGVLWRIGQDIPSAS
jgi:uncharacterized glyoxalase superfamily protein PhnB